MCARRVITIQKLSHTWVILMTTHFLYPKIGVSAWIFWNFFSLVKKGYLRQPFIKFSQQSNDYSENDLVLKLVDDFLATRYASLTIKSSHFVWSITSRNLNTLRTGVRYIRTLISAKNSSFRLPYQCLSSSVDCARELFKGSNGSASLVDYTWKNFLVWGADFLWLTS